MQRIWAQLTALPVDAAPLLHPILREFAAQVQSFTEVFAVSVLRDECCSEAVQPAQGLFAKLVDVEELFDIKNTISVGTNIVSNPQEFFHP
jgi:hypothetical protein